MARHRNENEPSVDLDRKVGIARKIEMEIEASSISRGFGVASSVSDVDQDIDPDSLKDSLNDNDRHELDRIREALAFLNDVREDLEKNPGSVETPGPGETVDDFLDNTAVASDRSFQSASLRRMQHKPGRRIGRFEIIKLVGRGGFAKVFLAQDPELDRPVALKILKPSLYFSEDASGRFEREARAAAILSHPNIVPVFDHGREGDSRYIVSGYCDAVTLLDWFTERKRKTTTRLAAGIIATLAEAMEHAHQRGIVHRDLKPSNILIERTIDELASENIEESLPARLRVTDFGLARTMQTSDQLETVEGAIVGTPAYMSPEQARSSNNVDATTDIYSLGVMLYELLTGSLPILKDSPLETLVAIRLEDPTPVRSVNRAVPVDLSAICMKCLHKSPEDRYPSAYSLAEDLRRWSDGGVVAARSITTVERFAKWCRRNPLLTFAFAGMAAGLLLAIAGWRSASINRTLAESNAITAENETDRAERNVALSQETIKEMISTISSSSQIPPEMRHTLVNRAVELQNKLLADNADDPQIIYETAVTYNNLALVFYDMREWQSGLDAAEHASELLDVCPENAEVQKARFHLEEFRARFLGHLGRHDEALELLNLDGESNRSLYQQAGNFRLAGETLTGKGDLEGAILEYEKGRLIFETLDSNIFIAGDHSNLLNGLGLAEIQVGRYEDAEQNLTLALEKQKEVMAGASFHESMSEQLGKVLNTLGFAQACLDKNSEAVTNLKLGNQQFAELTRINPGKIRFHTQLVGGQLDLFDVQFGMGNLDAASETLVELDQSFENMPDEFHERTFFLQCMAGSQLDLVEAFRNDSEPESAAQHFTRAEELMELLETADPDSTETTSLRSRLDELRD